MSFHRHEIPPTARGQQTDEPVGGDPGAHGVFDAKARPHSPQLWTDLRRDWIADGLLALVLLAAGAFLAGRQTTSR